MINATRHVAISSCLLSFLSCETATNTSKTERQIIRATLPFEVEGLKCTGSCSIQRKVSQKISFTLNEDAAAIIIRTCHRDQIFKSVPKGPFSYIYSPAYWVENTGECSLEIQVISTTAKISFGFMSFSSEETLNADLFCNGERIKTTLGVGVCQARTGLVQRISFNGQVPIAIEGTGCAKMEPESEAKWAYSWTQSIGYCVYSFRTVGGEKFRLVTRGYNEMER